MEPYDGHVFGGFKAIYHRLYPLAVEGRRSRGHFASTLVQQGAWQVLPRSVVEKPWERPGRHGQWRGVRRRAASASGPGYELGEKI